MSPNESQLRAALRDGEGQALDVDGVVAGATQAQRARRQRAASVAGAVVVVGAVALGAVALNGGTTPRAGSTLSERSAGNANGPIVPYPLVTSFPGGSKAFKSLSTQAPVANPPAYGAAAACPSSLPHLLLPGGGGTTQFGSSGAVFASPVATIRVCVYQGDVTVPGASGSTGQVLGGDEASNLAASLENAATTRAGRACPGATTGEDPLSFAMYATSRSGAALPVVTAVLGCPGLVTNGTAARYFWAPPTSIATAIEPPRSSAPHTR